METVGAYEAKTHLPKLLERVMKGERITITKHWCACCLLNPPDPEKTVDAKSVIAELRKLRNGKYSRWALYPRNDRRWKTINERILCY